MKLSVSTPIQLNSHYPTDYTGLLKQTAQCFESARETVFIFLKKSINKWLIYVSAIAHSMVTQVRSMGNNINA